MVTGDSGHFDECPGCGLPPDFRTGTANDPIIYAEDRWLPQPIWESEILVRAAAWITLARGIYLSVLMLLADKVTDYSFCAFWAPMWYLLFAGWGLFRRGTGSRWMVILAEGVCLLAAVALVAVRHPTDLAAIPSWVLWAAPQAMRSAFLLFALLPRRRLMALNWCYRGVPLTSTWSARWIGIVALCAVALFIACDLAWMPRVLEGVRAWSPVGD